MSELGNRDAFLHSDTFADYQKALLLWHLNLHKENPDDYRIPIAYSQRIEFAACVLLHLPLWSRRRIVIDDASVLGHLLVYVDGRIENTEESRWVLPEKPPKGPVMTVYPGNLLKWPVQWPMLDNKKFPEQSVELEWREFCREGLCL